MFKRNFVSVLEKRVAEKRNFIQVVTGPRQVGKTFGINMMLQDISIQTRFASCDDPEIHDRTWIEQQWELARLSLKQSKECLLIFDEIQKVPRWAEVIKRLWDEDTRLHNNIKLVLSGSSALLVHKGLDDSLTGRFELIHVRHWSYPEMKQAFNWDLETYIIHGSYPGAAPLISEFTRWKKYIHDSIIETTISKDILQLEKIKKPALLQQLFHLACSFSGKIVSFHKLTGQLQDAGNTTTLSHYLNILQKAGMIQGINKYSTKKMSSKTSSPKLNALTTSFMTVHFNEYPGEVREKPDLWGRLVETAVGAHLCNSVFGSRAEVYYWRERQYEVDFVLKYNDAVIPIEVKTGRRREKLPGIEKFIEKFNAQRKILVGTGGMPLEEFFNINPVELFY